MVSLKALFEVEPVGGSEIGKSCQVSSCAMFSAYKYSSYVLRHAVFFMCYKPESPNAVLWQDVYIFLHACILFMLMYSN